MENILITGITGSGGSYLAEYIVKNHPNIKVWGICRWHSTSVYNNILSVKNDIILRECDLMDISSIIRILQECKPTKIFHLAAYANVRKCFDTPLSVVNNNVMGTANLLEAVKMICPQSIIQICSTSEVYGNPEQFPMTEEHPLKPVNPYSASKLAGESLAYSYFKSWGLKVVITRMFAYINPRRSDLFASAFAKQIVELENEECWCDLYHGNLDSIRTLIDVRDAMETYWIASEKCDFGTPYNIGGKDVVSVGQLLDILIDRCKNPLIRKIESKDLLRPVDVTKQIPDTTKFFNKTGWEPKYTLNESVDFLLDYYRKEFYK